MPALDSPYGLYSIPGSAIILYWVNPASAVSNNIYRADHYWSPFTLIASATGTNYTDSTAISERDYYYRITDLDVLGVESQPSKIIRANSTAQTTGGTTSTERGALQDEFDRVFDRARSTDGYDAIDIVRYTSTGGDPATGEVPTITDTSLLSQFALLVYENRFGFDITDVTLPEGRLKKGALIFVTQVEVLTTDRIRYPNGTGTPYEVLAVFHNDLQTEWNVLARIEA